MTPDQARACAATVCHAFRAPPETLQAYMIALKGFDYADMNAACQTSIVEYDRLPSVKAILGLYYARRRAGSQESGRSSVPCAYCQEEGGYRIEAGGTLYPPVNAPPPYDGMTQHSGDDGQARGPAWPHRPACTAHASDQAWASRMVDPRAQAQYLPRPGMDPAWRARVYQTAGIEDPGARSPGEPGPLAGELSALLPGTAP